jgi:hypothetical protein
LVAAGGVDGIQQVEKVAGLSRMPSTGVCPSAWVRLSLSWAVASRQPGSLALPGCIAGFHPVHAGHFPVDQGQLVGLAGMRLLQRPQGCRAAVHRVGFQLQACSMWTKTSRAAALSSTTSARMPRMSGRVLGCVGCDCALPSLQVKLKQLPVPGCC